MTSNKGKVVRVMILKNNNNWLMKWHVPLAWLRLWRHYTTLFDTAVKLTTWGFGGKRNSSGTCAPLCYVDFVLACHATFLISINIFSFFILFFLYYHFINDSTFCFQNSLFFNRQSVIQSLIQTMTRSVIRSMIRSDPVRARFYRSRARAIENKSSKVQGWGF